MTTHQLKSRSFRLRLKSFIRNKNLSPPARFLWVLIDSFADDNGDDCFPSIPLLAKHSGHPDRWVKRYLKELKDAGFLEVKKRRSSAGWSNLYVLKASVPTT